MTNELGLRHPGRREAAVAVAIACVLLVVAWVANLGSEAAPPRPDGVSTLASSPDDSLVDLDLRGDVPAGAVEACLTPAFASSAAEVTVLYAKSQKTNGGTTPVLVLRNRAGELRLCDSFGGDAPSVAPVRRATSADPVRLLTAGRQAWDCDGNRLAAFTLSSWLSVAPKVHRVDARFLIDGTAGPWFTTQPQRGLAHLHAWLSEQNDGAEVAVQTRVLDKSGSLVDQAALPLKPQQIAACTGGPAQIG